MENDKNWYVVYTKPKFERKVADLLQKKKLNCYHPRYNQVPYWQEKRKAVDISLFASWVFVYASEKDHATIKQTDGVSGFLYWLQKPVIINKDELSSIRHFLERHDNVKLEKIPLCADQGENEIQYSPIQPYGVINFSNLYKLNLPSLGYVLISETIVEDVKVVA